MCGIYEYCHPERTSQPAEYDNSDVGDAAHKHLESVKEMWTIPVRPDRLGFALELYQKELQQRGMITTMFSSAKAAGSKRSRDSMEDDEASRATKEGKSDGQVFLLPREIEDIIVNLAAGEEVTTATTEEKRWLQGYLCSQGAHEECQHVTDEKREEEAAQFDNQFGLCPCEVGDPWPWEDENEENYWNSSSEFSDKKYDADDRGWDDNLDLPIIDKAATAEDRQRARRRRRDAWENYKTDEMLDELQTSELLAERGGGTRRNDEDWIERITAWIQGYDEADMHNDWDDEEAHEEIMDDWKELFEAGGKFDKLRKVLRDCFGLDAFLTQGEVAESTEFYHCQAFLFVHSKSNTDRRSDVEASHDIEVMPVDEIEPLSEKKKALFARALKCLGLEPDIHPASSSDEVDSDMWKAAPNQLLPIQIWEKVAEDVDEQ